MDRILVASFAALIAVIQLLGLIVLGQLVVSLLGGEYGLVAALMGGFSSARLEVLMDSNPPSGSEYLIANAIRMPIATAFVVLAARRRA